MNKVERNEHGALDLLSAKNRITLLENLIFPITGDSSLFWSFASVRREDFVPPREIYSAYSDHPIQLEEAGASISQPSLVAMMINLMELKGDEEVLEVGTGTGYEASILSHCCKGVCTIERNKLLVDKAIERVAHSGVANVQFFCGDGALGLPDKAPFDAIVVSAAVKEIPIALIEQLAEGGRIVIPVEDEDCQKLVVGVKKEGQLQSRKVYEVNFHPLVSNVKGCYDPSETGFPEKPNIVKLAGEEIELLNSGKHLVETSEETREAWEEMRRQLEEFAKQFS